jgi:mTERF domain-containing protein
MGKLISKAPSILALSIPDNLEPKLNWLQQRLDLNDAQVSKIVRRLPTIIQYSIPNKLEPTLKWLQQQLSLDGDELAKLVESQPPLLGCSIPINLEPTLDFYKECIGIEGTKQLLARNPSLFGYSLESRLKPRLEQLKGAELEVDARWLLRMAKYTEAQWQASLVYQREKLGKTLKEPSWR